ncbi:MAG: ABC transporter ATP-binding protein, partial [Rhodobacteraceae bacterium]|nr:ABC transporter ATP-binding protein [Paracoccaceae bacterium]
MDDIILKTEDVGVIYDGSIVALENVSLNVPTGKLTA